MEHGEYLFNPCQNFWPTLSWADNHSYCEFMIAIAMSCPEDSVVQHSSLPFNAYILSVSSVLFRATDAKYRRPILGPSTKSLILITLTSYTSSLSTAWRVDQVYKYKQEYLEGNLAVWLLNKLTIVGSTLGPMTFLVMGIWRGLQYQAWNHLLRSRSHL